MENPPGIWFEDSSIFGLSGHKERQGERREALYDSVLQAGLREQKNEIDGAGDHKWQEPKQHGSLLR